MTSNQVFTNSHAVTEIFPHSNCIYMEINERMRQVNLEAICFKEENIDLTSPIPAGSHSRIWHFKTILFGWKYSITQFCYTVHAELPSTSEWLYTRIFVFPLALKEIWNTENISQQLFVEIWISAECIQNM